MLLQIKPLLTFAEDGQLTSVAKVRGRNQVADKLVDLTVKACGGHKRYNLAVANGGAPEEMETVRKLLTDAKLRMWRRLPDEVSGPRLPGGLSVWAIRK